MTEMVRKQIYIEKRQESLLKKWARRRRVSEAEIIREAIDKQLGEAAQSFHPDPQAWEQALAFMKSLHARGPLPNQGRTWKREDAYEERMSRYGRDSR